VYFVPYRDVGVFVRFYRCAASRITSAKKSGRVGNWLMCAKIVY
jgi:hypothetical protein